MPSKPTSKASSSSRAQAPRATASSSRSNPTSESKGGTRTDAWNEVSKDFGYEPIPNLLLNRPQSLNPGIKPLHVWVLMKLVQLARQNVGKKGSLLAEYRPGRVRLLSLDQLPVERQHEVKESRSDRTAAFAFLAERTVLKCLADLRTWGLIESSIPRRHKDGDRWRTKSSWIDVAPLIKKIRELNEKNHAGRRRRHRDDDVPKV